MTFRDLSLLPEYRSPQKNITGEFYVPALKLAVLYSRAVGFFSSSALSSITEGVSALAKRGGKIKIVASPKLSDDDITAINLGYKKRNEAIESALINSLESATNFFEKESLNFLSNLIAKNILDIKIAIMENDGKIGMYHEKMGIMVDADGNKIAFSGSMNETRTALSLNYEAIDVFCDWKSEESAMRAEQKEKAFDAIWGNREKNICALDFPKVKEEILRRYKSNDAIDFEIDEREFENEEMTQIFLPKSNVPKMPESLELYDYQKRAIENWRANNFIGIFDMATGTGKTFTALAAVVTLSEKINGNFCVIILCPYIHLVMQWVQDIEKFNINPIIAFGSSPQKNWKEKLKRAVQKRNFHSDEQGFFCLVSSVATFKSDFVQSNIEKIKKSILLIADEAHNLGANDAQKFLQENHYQYRLALSATIERHFDKNGTEILYEFFGEKCIEYNLETAIAQNHLAPYNYFPVIVNLNEDERENYLVLTNEIEREIRLDKSTGKKMLTERGKKLCINRAKIVAGAESKLPALLDKIAKYKDAFNILIYCGATKYYDDYDANEDDDNSIRQIDKIVKTLYEKYEMKITKFIAEKTSFEREEIIKNFSNKNIQALAAIRCLDEGVNIPSIRIAFILASSTNPKEYIQRRGRVLRLSAGKDFAEIYDFVCLPYDIETLSFKTQNEKKVFKSLAAKEVFRMKEFSRLAKNSCASLPLIQKIQDIFNIDENAQMEVYENE